MFYAADDCDLAAFETQINQELNARDVPLAFSIEKNIPIYDARDLELGDALKREWAWVLGAGSGVLVIKNSYLDTTTLDEAAEIFQRIIADEKEQSGGGGDHFATAGANDRIWNSLQKLCLADPSVFAGNFGNPFMALVCEAWLGPAYQMTAQVNLVRPGGKAQTAHRDYHLGFMTEEQALAYPSHAHALSPVLTLQGAIAHCDMPIESGPTKLLPFSQIYGPGYLAYRRAEFADLFEERFVQLPLEKGDLLFFNPALFHGAGDNVSDDIQRLGNLVQVSSAMGRAMESLDRDAMCKALYPVLLEQPDGPKRDAIIAAAAEGYSFPTSLDSDPPIGGLAPKTQADLMRKGLAEGHDLATFAAALDALNNRKKP